METLITFKTAKLAKDKGFSSCLKSTIIISWSQDRDYRTQIPYEPNCFLNGEHFEDYEYSKEEFKSLFKDDDSYSADVQIPSQSVLQKWLREEYNIRIFCTFETIDDSETAWVWNIVKDNIEGNGRKKDTWDFYDRWDSFSYMMWWKDYEEAMEEGLFQALNLI